METNKRSQVVLFLILLVAVCGAAASAVQLWAAPGLVARLGNGAAFLSCIILALVTWYATYCSYAEVAEGEAGNEEKGGGHALHNGQIER